MTIDLTKITTPFCLLDEETQQALKNWPHGLEFYSILGLWEDALSGLIGHTVVYRAKPKPLTKPVIPWDFLEDE